MMLKALCVFSVLIFAAPNFLFSQADNVLWASTRLRIVPNEKNALDLRPIVRYNNDISSYQNFSVDVAYRYNLSSKWTLGMISRTWFMKDGSNRQFIWPAVIYKSKIGNLNFTNRFMYHYAIDVKGVPDNDFFRLKPNIAKSFNGKHKIDFTIEPWFQFDGFNEITRVRYELGFSTKLGEHISAGIVYRKQNDKGDRPDANHYVTTLTYQL